jgi:hypothetical protein
MCEKLNFVYMIDRMKYQCFDFFAISFSKTEKRKILPNIHRIVEREKFCGWKILQPRPLSTFPKFSIGISASVQSREQL